MTEPTDPSTPGITAEVAWVVPSDPLEEDEAWGVDLGGPGPTTPV